MYGVLVAGLLLYTANKSIGFSGQASICAFIVLLFLNYIILYMKKIPLTMGMFALVDDKDFDDLNKFKWYAWKGGNNFYAYTMRFDIVSKKQKRIGMHRYIMNTPKGLVTDHINGNGLDNRRSNLRICTHAENIRNSRKPTANTSGLKGVSWNKNKKKWQAQIRHKKNIHLGYFDDKYKAYFVYCDAAHMLHGKFARE